MQNNDTISSLKQQLADEIESHRKTKIKLKMREHENHAITTSRSYKLARTVSVSGLIARKVVSRTKSLNPKRVVRLTKNRNMVSRSYGSASFSEQFPKSTQAKIAVVLHLYYTDTLPVFMNKLRSLENFDYDLYVTIPQNKVTELTNIRQKLPTATIVTVPNCGRDVLPFIAVMKQLKNLHYDAILKLHSKKSPHRDDGPAWRDGILDSLLPENPTLIKEIISTLKDKQTAIVGPGSEYVSLLVNFSATEHHMKKLLKRIGGIDQRDYVMRHKDEFGFFGGTMFWVQPKSIQKIIDTVNYVDFEPELGQTDSTMAHALERLFNLIPELNRLSMYELRDGSITQRDYQTTNIPTWAEYNIDD